MTATLPRPTIADQYDLGMEYVGHATDGDQIVFRGDPATRQFIALWLQQGQVTAAMNVNVWDVVEHLKTLVRTRTSVDPARLADPEVPLEALATAGAPRGQRRIPT